MFLLSKFISTCCFIGYFPFAPGTFGSLIFVIPLFFLSFYSIYFNLILFILLFIVSAYSIDYYMKILKKEDPKEIVIDEFLGLMIAFIMLRLVDKNYTLKAEFLFLIFFFFRFFDIYKPYPISYIDNNIKSGFGVILDDVVAGIFTSVAILIVMILLNVK